MEPVTQLYSTRTDLHERRPFELHVSKDAGFVPMAIASHSCRLFLPIYCRAPLRSCSGPAKQKKPE